MRASRTLAALLVMARPTENSVQTRLQLSF